MAYGFFLVLNTCWKKKKWHYVLYVAELFQVLNFVSKSLMLYTWLNRSPESPASQLSNHIRLTQGVNSISMKSWAHFVLATPAENKIRQFAKLFPRTQ